VESAFLLLCSDEARNVVLDARAGYSRFRRFQVTSETEAKVKIVK
jgi:hypothetical protein